MWLRDVDPRVGGKAANLALLLRAGLRVPDGIVILEHAPVPRDLELAAPWVVRSSASIEDGERTAAPGVFASERDVTPQTLEAAVDRVRASASSVAARAYLAARGIDSVSMAVIVQRQVTPERARGVIYTRRPGDRASPHLLIEVYDGDVVRAAVVVRGSGDLVERDPGFPVDDVGVRELATAGLAAERALGREDGADVEWVLSDDGAWIVQARPIVHRAPIAHGPPPEAFEFSRAEPDVIWRWDVTHNPDPLTPAQIALVNRVAAIGGYRTQVVEGYLYTAPRRDRSADSQLPPTAPELAAAWTRARTGIDRVLAPLEVAGPAPLAAAVAAYERAFAIYSELSAVVARARAAAGDRASAAAIPLGGPHTGSLSRAWDVGARTFGEDHSARPQPDPAADIELAADRDLRSLVAAIAEADDLLFYRAQAIVRRALLAIAGAWRLAEPSDIFYFPLVAAARAERQRRLRYAMPIAIAAGRPLRVVDGTAGPDAWRGRGGGGSARGIVARVGDLGELDGDGEIVVARTLTPAMVAKLRNACAIVSEFGGMLGHAAAMARELALPYVVGCVGAWTALASGDEVVVDGDAGLVVRVRTGSGQRTY